MKTMTRMAGSEVELGSEKCYETEKYDTWRRSEEATTRMETEKPVNGRKLENVHR